MIFSKKNIALTLASTMFFSVLISGKSIADKYKVREFKEILGVNRVETSIKTSNLVKSDVAVIASAYNYADALSSYNLVKSNKAKLVLVSNEKDVEKALKGLKLSKAFIIGGESVVGKDIENKVKEFCGDTTRISGKDRYETNNKTLDVAKFTEVGVADGRNFPDALVAGGLLNNKGYGLKLVKGNEPYTSSQKVVYTFGGKSSVNKDGGKRLSGSDRYTTADMINKEIGKINTSAITDGADYPDSLSALNILNLDNNSAIIISKKGQLTKTAKENILNTKEGNNYIIGGSVGKERVYQSLSSGIIEKVVYITKDEGGRTTGSYRPSDKKDNEDKKEEEFNKKVEEYRKIDKERYEKLKKDGGYVILVESLRKKDSSYRESTFEEKYPEEYRARFDLYSYPTLFLVYDDIPNIEKVISEVKRVYGPEANLDLTQEKLNNMKYVKPFTDNEGNSLYSVLFTDNISLELKVVTDEKAFNIYKNKINVIGDDEFIDLAFKVARDNKNMDYYINNVLINVYRSDSGDKRFRDYELPIKIEPKYRGDDYGNKYRGEYIDGELANAVAMEIKTPSNLLVEQYDKDKFETEINEYKKIIKNATNDSMTEKEKVYAVAKYLAKNYYKAPWNDMYPLTGGDIKGDNYYSVVNYKKAFNNIMFYMNKISYINEYDNSNTYVRVYVDGYWIDINFNEMFKRGSGKWINGKYVDVDKLDIYKNYMDIPDEIFKGKEYDKKVYTVNGKSEYQRVQEKDKKILDKFGKYFGY